MRKHGFSCHWEVNVIVELYRTEELSLGLGDPEGVGDQQKAVEVTLVQMRGYHTERLLQKLVHPIHGGWGLDWGIWCRFCFSHRGRLSAAQVTMEFAEQQTLLILHINQILCLSTECT